MKNYISQMITNKFIKAMVKLKIPILVKIEVNLIDKITKNV